MSKANGNGKPRRVGKKPGPKTKLTPQLMRRVTKLAGDGLSQNQISLIVGVHPVTLSRYKKESAKFIYAIKTGLERGVATRLRRIAEAAKKGAWQADAWWLERVKREQFGRYLEVSGAGGGPVQTQETKRIEVVVVEAPKQLGNGAAADLPVEAVVVPAKEGNGK